MATLQTTLGATYTLERELGGGGMSRVFLASDATLSRQVVVKVLTPELAQGMSADRFAREIRLAAALQDPHIVPVLAAGTTTDGLPYYTMPFVEGRSLRARLGDGQVPLDDALRILRDIGEALEYAHGHGVVHRDIKPENVLLAGRNAVVADFGIAKAINAAKGGVDRPEGNTGALTQLGQSLGTPAYMAPEQATGDLTDHRADLYSWGVVAYELLAGTHPFAHKTSAQQLIAAQVMEQPKSLNEVRPGIPAPLGALVMRCLAKTPTERPATATELLAELSAVSSSGNTATTRNAATVPQRSRPRVIAMAGAIVVVLAIALGATLMRRNRPAAATTDHRPSLVVLPFEHQGDSTDAYLTDGLTDEIRGKLTGVRDLVVIARASSNAYRATTKSPREIAEELGVRYLLSGTVRIVGTGDQRRVLVRPELVEVTGSAQPQSRWQQPVDMPVADVIQVQREIAQKVVTAMEVAVAPGDRATLTRVPTRDPVAYDLYLRGRAAIGWGAAFDAASLRASITLMEQVLARDSMMVEAWTQLASSRALFYANVTPTAKLAREARAAAERTLALDPSGVLGHRAMSAFYGDVERDPVRGLAEAREAYRAAPGDAISVGNLAVALADSGKWEDALRTQEEAARLDPRNAGVLLNLARSLRNTGRLPEAREVSAKAAALAPTAVTIVQTRISTELEAGDVTAARRLLEEALRNFPRSRLLPYVATYGADWLLDANGQQDVLNLTADDYSGDRPTWALVRARIDWWSGDSASRRAWGDTAVRLLRLQLADVPNDFGTRGDLAEALAHIGQRAEAIAVAQLSLKIARAQTGGLHVNMELGVFGSAIVAAAVADAPEVAIPWIDQLHSFSALFSAARLSIDPFFKDLRDDPGFQRLLQKAK
jgi:serine/threonine-protein kinase